MLNQNVKILYQIMEEEPVYFLFFLIKSLKFYNLTSFDGVFFWCVLDNRFLSIWFCNLIIYYSYLKVESIELLVILWENLIGLTGDLDF